MSGLKKLFKTDTASVSWSEVNFCCFKCLEPWSLPPPSPLSSRSKVWLSLLESKSFARATSPFKISSSWEIHLLTLIHKKIPKRNVRKTYSYKIKRLEAWIAHSRSCFYIPQLDPAWNGNNRNKFFSECCKGYWTSRDYRLEKRGQYAHNDQGS